MTRDALGRGGMCRCGRGVGAFTDGDGRFIGYCCVIEFRALMEDEEWMAAAISAHRLLELGQNTPTITIRSIDHGGHRIDEVRE